MCEAQTKHCFSVVGQIRLAYKALVLSHHPDRSDF